MNGIAKVTLRVQLAFGPRAVLNAGKPWNS
jgi:hypothetical protein